MPFSHKDEQTPAISTGPKGKYTSLLQTEGFTFLGREDGDVEVFNDVSKGRTRIFDKTFDPLENEDIDKHVNAMAYLSSGGVAGTLFAGNDRHIKTIQVRNDTSTRNICNGNYSENLRFSPQKVCQNVHTYALSSMSINSSGEYLITSDYIKVNLWNPLALNSFYNIVDIKSQLSCGLVFVINISKFSPFADSIFGYSTSNGRLIINDTSVTPRSESVASLSLQNIEGIRSISDFLFFDENLIVTRTMNNVSVFDMRNPKQEIYSRNLVTDLSELNILNSETTIYEKFGMVSHRGRVYTGSYFGSIYSIDISKNECEEVQIKDERECVPENKIKLIVWNGKELVCVIGDTKLVKYQMAEK
ncbi:uncharacterized protein VICG_02020 [Vittaforma corneae ATCC 50505]|uniref:Uncharacterized protein n=1 Tax=Vittaforma corneae (strain ATCC 50505) TaxID=993615 RepID=L2GJ92_VITCO|nr:uncharacterized protein VICG_02020 [Vittaforma corneae ATCC 50505]ELA40931.1 hypothetical protein VICG_02020 [Vittaforma corneae ATCC 50505]